MKKIIILVTMAATAIAASSNAQEAKVVRPQETAITAARQSPPDPRCRFYIGLKAGYNYANVYDTHGEDFEADPKFGIATGVFLTIPIAKFIGIQPEVLFSQKGFKATGSLLGNPYELHRTTNFIDVPLMIAIMPLPFMTLLAGPQFSYLLKQRDEFKGTPLTAEAEEDFRNDDIRKNMLCFLGGIDFNFSNIVLGTRVGWDVRNNTGDGTSTTPRYKNVWLQATMGFRF